MQQSDKVTEDQKPEENKGLTSRICWKIVAQNRKQQENGPKRETRV